MTVMKKKNALLYLWYNECVLKDGDDDECVFIIVTIQDSNSCIISLYITHHTAALSCICKKKFHRFFLM